MIHFFTCISTRRGLSVHVQAKGESAGEFVATSDSIELAAEIVVALVSHKSLSNAELPALIEAVHATVKRLARRAEIASAVIDSASPAVPIRESITPDYLICLEDGKRYKTLRRHLTLLGMTPDHYRAKWGLSSTYPMVAPNYAAQQSAAAKNISLCQMDHKPVAAPPQATAKRMFGRLRKVTA
jgi:predicted transcriptional regulator